MEDEPFQKAALLAPFLFDDLKESLFVSAVLTGQRENDLSHIGQLFQTVMGVTGCDELGMFFYELVVQGACELPS